MMIKLPRKINLRAISQLWKVSYIKSAGTLDLIEEPHRQLTLYGRHYTKTAALSLIIRWLRLKADRHIIAMVKKLNLRVKVKYKKVMIRSPQTQWGSYLRSKTISLDYKLIFLPPRLVRNVILHELCHVRYWGHTVAFWRELTRYDKHTKKNDAALNHALSYIPTWAT